MDQFLEELTKGEVSFITFKVCVRDDGLCAKKVIKKPLLEVINEETGLTKEELIEMFKPVDNAIEYCTKKLFERINEGKK